MTLEIKAYNISALKEYKTVNIELPRKCPCCANGIEPKFLNAYYTEFYQQYFLFILYFCPLCDSCFIGKYYMYVHNFGSASASLDVLFPHTKETTKFPDNIVSLSPEFVKIYNEAEKAQAHELTAICGLGYRKALEFLIKDFAIHNHPEHIETIKSMPLSQCIKKYIANDNIKILAERSAWIGNDEAHYVRKQDDRDVSDMKAFIQATVYFIGMMLITEDAASMLPK